MNGLRCGRHVRVFRFECTLFPTPLCAMRDEKGGLNEWTARREGWERGAE